MGLTCTVLTRAVVSVPARPRFSAALNISGQYTYDLWEFSLQFQRQHISLRHGADMLNRADMYSVGLRGGMSTSFIVCSSIIQCCNDISIMQTVRQLFLLTQHKFVRTRDWHVFVFVTLSPLTYLTPGAGALCSAWACVKITWIIASIRYVPWWL